MLMVIITTFSIRINMPSHTKRYRIITRVVSAIAFVVFVATYFGTSLLVNIGMKPDFWKQDRGYKNYGFTLMFFLNTRYVRDPDPPKDYDPGYISQTAQKYSGIYDSESTDNSTTTVKPNIICIMNESLSDLSVLGDFETNEDYMPFIRSLTKNTVRGNLYVPVVGAGTSNTELEFLSGHTTAFLPSGSNAYMLYIRNPLGTMVTTLKRQGYSTLAFHPYYASGWNRTSVYNFMEFDRFVSMEDLFTPEYMKAYEKCSLDPAEISAYDREVHPDEQVLLRQYVSDSYDFKYIIKDFENRQKGVPYFIFNVTMQNHGGYMMQYPNFDETIKVTSGSKDYPKANQYLSLVKQSDDAFKELISYFEKVDEPTIICMFGDHQPTIENDFIEEVMGVSSLSFLSPEQEQLRHVTPFIIWSNYDIKEQKIERLSVNYLSSLLLEIAGVKLTPYNKAMLAFKDRLPVINSVGYIDNDGNHYSWGQTTEYSDLLQDYEILQYNNIFDVANRDDSVFYLTDGKQGQK
ncbi:MAG: LTA synthase family protein [Clostridia bacterium]|nr:LTA synthase family protein [Clostridia bacterium]